MSDKLLRKIKKCIPKKAWNVLWPFYHFALGMIGDIIYGSPSQRLIVIGVTGTTGKTTSAYLIAQVLRSAGYKVGFTSTAMFSDGNKDWLNDKKMTMPGRLFNFKMLHSMVKNGCQFAIVETTSEGIVQYRHRFINYDTLVFTGLYPEHIESHGSFANYKEAKGMLFAHLKDCKTKYTDDDKKVKKVEAGLKKLSLDRVKKIIIANGDDESADYFLNYWSEDKIVYYVKNNPDQKYASNLILETRDIDISNQGTRFVVKYGNEAIAINMQILGGFNIYNAYNAIAVALAHGLYWVEIKKGLEAVTGIPGRLEKIAEGQNFTVMVDYAFEPNAVEKLYETVKLIPHRKIIHVLGSAGGGRDVARRPILGKIAGAEANTVIITNEDPYDDDPQLIIDQIGLGAEKSGKVEGETLFKIIDRREAIAKALSLANDNDVVLITGKGSEQAICLAKGVKEPWDDRVVVREELANLKNN